MLTKALTFLYIFLNFYINGLKFYLWQRKWKCWWRRRLCTLDLRTVAHAKMSAADRSRRCGRTDCVKKVFQTLQHLLRLTTIFHFKWHFIIEVIKEGQNSCLKKLFDLFFLIKCFLATFYKAGNASSDDVLCNFPCLPLWATNTVSTNELCFVKGAFVCVCACAFILT